MKFCPICNSTHFVDFNGRKNAKCGQCGSLERHRTIALALFSLNLKPDSNVAIVSTFDGLGVWNFLPPLLNVELLKITNLDENIDTKQYDIIIHEHWVGRINNNLIECIRYINNMLRPDGHQIFTMVFNGQKTNLTPDEKNAFNVGGDFQTVLSQHGFKVIPSDLFEIHGASIIEECSLGISADQKVSANSAFMLKKI
jgi:hypothetical protein